MLRLLFTDDPITVTFLYVGLWTDAGFEPDRFTALSDLTEANFPGYVRVGIGRTPWRNAITDDLGRGATYYLAARPTFTASDDTDQTVYGHMVWNPATDALWWVEKWAEPRRFRYPDDAVKILMPLTLTSVHPPIEPEE